MRGCFAPRASALLQQAVGIFWLEQRSPRLQPANREPTCTNGSNEQHQQQRLLLNLLAASSKQLTLCGWRLRVSLAGVGDDLEALGWCSVAMCSGCGAPPPGSRSDVQGKSSSCGLAW